MSHTLESFQLIISLYMSRSHRKTLLYIISINLIICAPRMSMWMKQEREKRNMSAFGCDWPRNDTIWHIPEVLSSGCVPGVCRKIIKKDMFC